jgi:hypothetical protein
MKNRNSSKDSRLKIRHKITRTWQCAARGPPRPAQESAWRAQKSRRTSATAAVTQRQPEVAPPLPVPLPRESFEQLEQLSNDAPHFGEGGGRHLFPHRLRQLSVQIQTGLFGEIIRQAACPVAGVGHGARFAGAKARGRTTPLLHVVDGTGTRAWLPPILTVHDGTVSRLVPRRATRRTAAACAELVWPPLARVAFRRPALHAVHPIRLVEVPPEQHLTAAGALGERGANIDDENER